MQAAPSGPAGSNERQQDALTFNQARRVEAGKRLWEFASSGPHEKRAPLATPLPKRIAARKVLRNAQVGSLDIPQTMAPPTSGSTGSLKKEQVSAVFWGWADA